MNNFVAEKNLGTIGHSYSVDLNETLGLGDVVGTTIKQQAMNNQAKSIIDQISIQDQLTALKNQKPLPETTEAALLSLGPGAYSNRDQDFKNVPIPGNIAANKATADLIASLSSELGSHGTISQNTIIGDAIPQSKVIQLSNQKAPWDPFKYLGRPEPTTKQAPPQVVQSDIGNLNSLVSQYKDLSAVYSTYPKVATSQEQYDSGKAIYDNLQSLYGKILPLEQQQRQINSQQNNEIAGSNAGIVLANNDAIIGNALAQGNNAMAKANYELDTSNFATNLIHDARYSGSKDINVYEQTVVNAGDLTATKLHPIQSVPISQGITSLQDIIKSNSSKGNIVYGYTPGPEARPGAGVIDMNVKLPNAFENRYGNGLFAGIAGTLGNAGISFGAGLVSLPYQFGNEIKDLVSGKENIVNTLLLKTPPQPQPDFAVKFQQEYSNPDYVGGGVSGLIAGKGLSQFKPTENGLEYDIGSVIGTGALLAVGAKDIPSVVRGGVSFVKSVPSMIKGGKPITVTPEMIATDTLREGRSVYDLSKVDKSTYEFNQGTVAKSGDVSSNISALRVPNEMVPGMPNYSMTSLTKLPPGSNEIMGIGPKGEQIPTGTGTIKIPNPKGEGAAEIPSAILQPNKVSVILPKPSGLPENVLTFRHIDIETAKQLGLKPMEGESLPYEGAPPTYQGPTTPFNLKMIRGLIEQGKIAKVTDVLGYSPKDLDVNPASYYKPIREPASYDTFMAIKNGDIAAPEITGYYEGTYTGPKLNVPNVIKLNKDGSIKSIKNLVRKSPTNEVNSKFGNIFNRDTAKGSRRSSRAFSNTKINLGGNKEQTSLLVKPVGGLTPERLETLSKILKTQKPEKQNSQYPIYVPSESAKQRTKYQGGSAESIHDIIQYPSGTSPDILKLISLGKPEARQNNLQQPIYVNLKDLIKQPKNITRDKLITTVSERTQLGKGSQGLKLDLGTVQTQRGFSKQGIPTIIRQGQVQIPRQITTPKLGQYTIHGLTQEQVPTQTTVPGQLQQQIPKIPNQPPPDITKLIPPRIGGSPFGLGGYFGSGGRGGANSKKEYTLTYESSNIGVKYLEGYAPFSKSSSNPNILKSNEAANRKAIQDYNKSQKTQSISDIIAGFGFVTPKRISKRKKR